MKKFFSFFVIVACAAVSLMASPDIWASNVKQRAHYKYGDAMGTAPLDVWSSYDHNFYDKEGKPARSVQLWRSLDGVITINTKTEHIYDEQGQLVYSVEYQAYATSPENADGEYVFRINKRTVNEYYENGQLLRTYSQKWDKNKEDWDQVYKTLLYEYTYNEDGSKATEKYWLNQYSANVNNPSSTKTFEYSADGTVVKEISVGQYSSYCYTTEYTYDEQGRKIHSLSTFTMESSKDYGKTKEEKTWEYDGDLLISETTIDQYGAEKRILYSYVDNDPNHWFEDPQDWHEENQEWKNSSPMRNEWVQQDYTGMDANIPTLSVSVAGDNPRNNTVYVALPAASGDNYTVKVYRDGNEIKSLGKDEIASSGYTFADENLNSGYHEYYAQVVYEDGKESYISDIAKVQTVISYPEVSDFHIEGYTYNRTWIEPQTDPDTGETYDGYWIEDYKLVLKWTPLTEEAVKGYGFERYEIYYKSAAGDTPVENFDDITTGTATVDYLNRYTEVWLNVKYGEDRVSTEHITINLDELPNLSDVDPIPAYGVYYKGGYTPAFAEVDLARPEQGIKDVYDLWYDSKADLSSIYGGVSVGDTYYALYEDAVDFGISLGAFDMSGKQYVNIGHYNGGYEAIFSDLIYDADSDILYAVAPDAEASCLYTLNRTTGEAAKTDIALPAYTLYIASAGNGKAYAMAAETGNFQLYSVDLNAKTYAKVEGVTVSGSSNTWSSLLCMGNTLYFNLNTKYYTINLDTKAVTANNDFAKGMSGLTTIESSALPKIGISLTGEEHMITTIQSNEGTVNYFYNADNKLARVSEISTDGEIVRYTRNMFDAEGLMTSTEVSEPKANEYGVESMQVTSTSTYTYNEVKLLAEKNNSDGSWVRYTYNDDNTVATETYGNGETTSLSVAYMYDFDFGFPGKPVMAAYTSESNPDDNYIMMFGYDENGNKIVQYTTKDLMAGVYDTFETWEYFPKSNLVMAHNICSPTEFNEGEPIVLSSTRYQMVDNDPNHMISQEFEGEMPLEGTAKDLVYSNLRDTAYKSKVNLTVTESEAGVNNVNLGFGLPPMSFSESYSMSFYRDGILLGKLNVGDISGMADYVYEDKQVPNGKHEYFVRANGFGVNDADMPYQISEIIDIELNTELPVVSEIAYVKHEEKYVDAEGNILEDSTEGSQAYFVTIGWKTPEVPVEYGFKANHLFFMDGDAPVAVGVIDDAAVAQTVVNVGGKTSFDVLIQSRYALGVADSDIKTVSFAPVGIDTIDCGGFTVKIAGNAVVASEEAVISVFDLNGVRVATATDTSLDLSGLKGAYIVTAERNDAVRILKAIF